MNLNSKKALERTLRALQVLFALIVVGTTSYAIHIFHPHKVQTETPFGIIDGTYGVPNAWGFVLFCACFTILLVIFHFTLQNNTKSSYHVYISYFQVVIECVAVLSWFAGFIAVAVNIGTDTCPVDSCGALKVAMVFGGLEWILFVFTTFNIVMSVFGSSRSTKTANAGTDVAV